MSSLRRMLTLGLMISYVRETQGHYSRNVDLNFLCTPLEMAIYVRDVPWDCSSYVICISGMAIPTACPIGKLYASAERNSKCEPAINVNTSRCVGTVWHYMLEICRHNPRTTIPNAANCGQYFDCSNHAYARDFVEYLLECPYPTLYSTHTGACQDYRLVSCGARTEPKAPCEYHQYMQLYNCSDGNCAACNQHHPSCVGLANGHHPIALRDDIFIVCEGQRTMYIIPAPEREPIISPTTGRPTTNNHHHNVSTNNI